MREEGDCLQHRHQCLQGRHLCDFIGNLPFSVRVDGKTEGGKEEGEGGREGGREGGSVEYRFKMSPYLFASSLFSRINHI